MERARGAVGDANDAIEESAWAFDETNSFVARYYLPPHSPARDHGLSGPENCPLHLTAGLPSKGSAPWAQPAVRSQQADPSNIQEPP